MTINVLEQRNLPDCQTNPEGFGMSCSPCMRLRRVTSNRVNTLKRPSCESCF